MAKNKKSSQSRDSKPPERKGVNSTISESRTEAGGFILDTQEVPEGSVTKPRARANATGAKGRAKKGHDAQILSYRHAEKRKNNPEVGMVKPENDPEQPKTVWAYDSHLDPALQFDVGRA